MVVTLVKDIIGALLVQRNGDTFILILNFFSLVRLSLKKRYRL